MYPVCTLRAVRLIIFDSKRFPLQLCLSLPPADTSQLSNEKMKTNYLSVALAAGCFLCASGTHSQANCPGVETRVNAILDQMTLEEKLDYIGGTPGWAVKPSPRLGIPEIYGTDGTMGFNQSRLKVSDPGQQEGGGAHRRYYQRQGRRICSPPKNIAWSLALGRQST